MNRRKFLTRLLGGAAAAVVAPTAVADALAGATPGPGVRKPIEGRAAHAVFLDDPVKPCVPVECPPIEDLVFSWYNRLHDGGSLDLGIARDHSLDRTNDFRFFHENFEGLNLEHLTVTSSVCAPLAQLYDLHGVGRPSPAALRARARLADSRSDTCSWQG